MNSWFWLVACGGDEPIDSASDTGDTKPFARCVGAYEGTFTGDESGTLAFDLEIPYVDVVFTREDGTRFDGNTDFDPNAGELHSRSHDPYTAVLSGVLDEDCSIDGDWSLGELGGRFEASRVE